MMCACARALYRAEIKRPASRNETPARIGARKIHFRRGSRRSRRDRKSGSEREQNRAAIIRDKRAACSIRHLGRPVPVPILISRPDTANVILASRERSSSSKFIASMRLIGSDSESGSCDQEITGYRRAYIKRALKGRGGEGEVSHSAWKEADAATGDASAPRRSPCAQKSTEFRGKKNAGSRCIAARVSRGPRALRTKLNSCELDEDLEECALLWRASDAE